MTGPVDDNVDNPRIEGEHVAWCHQLMDGLHEGGTWTLPRSGLIYVKRGKVLILTMRTPHHPSMPMEQGEWEDYQDEDHANNKRIFGAAGYEIHDTPVKGG